MRVRFNMYVLPLWVAISVVSLCPVVPSCRLLTLASSHIAQGANNPRRNPDLLSCFWRNTELLLSVEWASLCLPHCCHPWPLTPGACGGRCRREGDNELRASLSRLIVLASSSGWSCRYRTRVQRTQQRTENKRRRLASLGVLLSFSSGVSWSAGRLWHPLLWDHPPHPTHSTHLLLFLTASCPSCIFYPPQTRTLEAASIIEWLPSAPLCNCHAASPLTFAGLCFRGKKTCTHTRTSGDDVFLGPTFKSSSCDKWDDCLVPEERTGFGELLQKNWARAVQFCPVSKSPLKKQQQHWQRYCPSGHDSSVRPKNSII